MPPVLLAGKEAATGDRAFCIQGPRSLWPLYAEWNEPPSGLRTASGRAFRVCTPVWGMYPRLSLRPSIIKPRYDLTPCPPSWVQSKPGQSDSPDLRAGTGRKAGERLIRIPSDSPIVGKAPPMGTSTGTRIFSLSAARLYQSFQSDFIPHTGGFNRSWYQKALRWTRHSTPGSYCVKATRRRQLQSTCSLCRANGLFPRVDNIRRSHSVDWMTG